MNALRRTLTRSSAVAVIAAAGIAGGSLTNATAAANPFLVTPGTAIAHGVMHVSRTNVFASGPELFWNVGSSPDQICNTNNSCFTPTENAAPTNAGFGANSLALTSGNSCLLFANSGGYWDSFVISGGNIASEASSIPASTTGGGAPIDIRVNGTEAVGVSETGSSGNPIVGFTFNNSTCILTYVNTVHSPGVSYNGNLVSATEYLTTDESGSTNNVYAFKIKNGALKTKAKTHKTAFSAPSGVSYTGAKKTLEIFTGQATTSPPQAQAMTSKFAQESGSPQTDGNPSASDGGATAADSANNQLYQAEDLTCVLNGKNPQVANYTLTPFKYENGATLANCDEPDAIVAGTGVSKGIVVVDGLFDIEVGTAGPSGASGFAAYTTTSFSTGIALTS